MATQKPQNRNLGAGSGYSNTVNGGAGNNVGSAHPALGTLALLGRVLIYVAIVVFVVTSFLAYIETKWMKAEIKSEAKELRKLRREIDELLMKGKNEKTVVPRPADGTDNGL